MHAAHAVVLDVDARPRLHVAQAALPTLTALRPLAQVLHDGLVEAELDS